MTTTNALEGQGQLPPYVLVVTSPLIRKVRP